MEQKPNVFPNKAETNTNSNNSQDIEQYTAKSLEEYEARKKVAVEEVYRNVEEGSQMSAVEMMRKRTEEQMNQKKEFGFVKDESLIEKSESQKRYEEQIRLRDEQIAKNNGMIDKYQQQFSEAQNRKTVMNEPPKVEPPANVPPIKPPTNTLNNMNEPNDDKLKQYIINLSQPNFNSPYDVIPLPSKGKLYPMKKSSIKVGYMTTADENILTSPNLLQSGLFLEVLMDRKILEPSLRYKNLHLGDRNAIMIWLRATSYGEMYPITVLDENEIPFDTEINLNDLKYKELGVEPDSQGLFNFTLPLSKLELKFKFLTCGVVDEIDEMVEQDRLNGIPVNNSNIYKLRRMIVSVNGDTSEQTINTISESMRIKDSQAFLNYVDEIESGVDLNIKVQTPGGGSITTFLPLNVNFFWPNFRV
jgi:hypothetical protein